METLVQDIRFGLRRLARKPGFTALAVLTLALGIGASTAIFSIVDAVVLRPLPIPRSGDVVTLWQSEGRELGERDTVSAPNYLDWKAQSQAFEAMAAYAGAAMTLTGQEEPELLRVGRVSGAFFRALGTAPSLGRTIQEADDRPEADRVVVVSEGLWKRRFGADRALLGRQLALDGRAHTVVGVIPAGLDWPQPHDAWTPLVLGPNVLAARGAQHLQVVARLRPGHSRREAQAEMTAIGTRLAEQYPDTNTGQGVVVVGLHELMVGDVRQALLILLGAVGCVVLIGCANVASLLLAQARSRAGELAIRAALGAGRSRVARQLLTESLLIALLGGGLGLFAASYGLEALLALAPSDLPRMDEIGIDVRVLAFTLGASLLTGVVFGVGPALAASHTDLQPALKEGGRTAPGAGRRFGSSLVIAEVALAVVLLAGAGLLMRSFWRLGRVDPGFDPGHVLTTTLFLPGHEYTSWDQRSAFYTRLVERLEALPGVESAGLTTTLPLSGWELEHEFRIEGRPEPPPGQQPGASYDSVSPEYFRALRIPLKAGRFFSRLDAADAPPVVIVSEGLAQRYWPDENPVGARVVVEEESREVVGVVGDVRHQGLDAAPRPEIYTPVAQRPWKFANVVVRSTADPESVAGLVRAAILAEDVSQASTPLRPLGRLVSASIAQPRFRTLLLGSFAGAALLLAAVGLYGVIAHTVGQRTREIGLRMALGARGNDIFRSVVGQGLGLATAGIGVGLAAAAVLTRLLSSLLFGIGSWDPATFAAVCLALLLVAVVACGVPARRATRIEPVEALRHE
jgi:putative ABC transport system permease protein